MLIDLRGAFSHYKDSLLPIHFNFVKDISSWGIYSSLSSHIGLVSAKIHESHFGSWVDFSKLDPSRVKLVNSFYEFKGPVWIVASTSWPLFVKKTLAYSVAGLSSALIARALLPKQKKDTMTDLSIRFIVGLGVGFIAWKQLDKIIPATRGIFFYN